MPKFKRVIYQEKSLDYIDLIDLTLITALSIKLLLNIVPLTL